MYGCTYGYIVTDGRKYRYPECCIKTFHILTQHDISPALIMDWVYGMDTVEGGYKYVRCPSCREYGGPSPHVQVAFNVMILPPLLRQVFLEYE